MMKMFMKVLLGLVALLLVVVLATHWFLSDKLDAYVRDTIVESGSRDLQTGFSIESVSVNIPRASAKLEGIEIDNPDGYSERPVLRVASVLIDFDISTINDEVLVIEEVSILDPLVNYEINDRGVANLDVLEQRIAQKSVAAPASDGERKLIVERLDFRSGSISARVLRDPDKELVFDFPVVFMTDLGRPDGASPEQLGQQVSAVLVERIINAAKKAGVQNLVEAQKEKLLERATEKLEEKLGDLIDRD